MSRQILETEKIEDEQLAGVTARLTEDSVGTTEIEHTGRDSHIYRYCFEEEKLPGENWYGQLDVEVYDENFQARGDEVLMHRYFAENRIQEPSY